MTEELSEYVVISKYQQESVKELVEIYREKGIELSYPHAIIFNTDDKQNPEIEQLPGYELTDEAKEMIQEMISALEKLLEEST
ncbi:MAG: hypothetical protein ACLFT7_05265 [Thermoplasmata archaeon]